MKMETLPFLARSSQSPRVFLHSPVQGPEVVVVVVVTVVVAGGVGLGVVVPDVGPGVPSKTVHVCSSLNVIPVGQP